MGYARRGLELLRSPRRSPGSEPRTVTVTGKRLAVPLLTRGEFSTRGTEVVETRATASVLFISENTLADIPVPGGTIVATDSGLEFATSAAAVIPRASFQTGPAHTTAKVEALLPGPDANVPPASLTRIAAELEESLVSVTNPEAAGGGSRLVRAVITREDYDTAAAVLRDRLSRDLEAELEGPGPYGLRLFRETAELGEIHAAPSPEELIGQAADWFELKLSATARVTAVDESELREIAVTTLRELVPDGFELLEHTIESSAVPAHVSGTSVTYDLEASAKQRGVALEPVGPLRFAVMASPNEQPAAGDRMPEGPEWWAPETASAVRLELPFEASAEFPATGIAATETRATGSVRFRSENTVVDIAIPAGMELRTASGIGFVTTEAIVLPRASFQSGPTRREAAIEAIQPGPEGNVAPGTIVRQPDDLADVLVRVVNPAPTQGGSREQFRVVSAADYDRATLALRRRVEEELAATLVNPPPAATGLKLFATTARSVTASVDPPADELVETMRDSFSLSLRSLIWVTGVDESAVAAVGEQALKNALPPGYVLDEDSIEISLSEGVVEDDAVRYTVAASAVRVGGELPARPARLTAIVAQDAAAGPEWARPAEPTALPHVVAEASGARHTPVEDAALDHARAAQAEVAEEAAVTELRTVMDEIEPVAVPIVTVSTAAPAEPAEEPETTEPELIARKPTIATRLLAARRPFTRRVVLPARTTREGRLALTALVGVLLVAALGIVVVQASRWLETTPPLSNAAGGLTSPSRATPPLTGATAGASVALNDSFDLWPIGSPPAQGWIASGGEPNSVTVAALPTSVDRSLKLSAVGNQEVGVCKAFTTKEQRLSMEATVQLDAPPASQAIVDVRAGSTPLARLGFASGRRFGMSRAGMLASSAVRYEPLTWYRLIATLDTATRTYEWEIRSADNESQLVAGAREKWPPGPESRPDAICIVARGGAEPTTVYIDEVTVRE